ncbi:hypothetical protein GQ457_13G010160 [Hibiscus cannabinus]
MDRLSQAIESSVINGRWSPIQITRRGPSLSHLFFVDDMVLFAEATMEQVGVIQDILSDFCKVSGHKVSIFKTQMCFSRNCALATKNLIARDFGFEVVEDLGKYLGVPLLHKRVTHATYAYVLDDMRARLSGWTAQSLSLAGRITLAKLVLQSIPIYVMQATWLPKGVCQEMEKLTRKFVWGGSGDKTSIALLSWDTIQRSPAQGGLGLKDLHNQNKAFLMKIGYNLITDEECLWVQVLKTKYRWTEVVPLDIKHTPCSRLWTCLSNICDDLKECIGWEIRDGSSTDFWYDQWLGEDERLAFSCLLPSPPRPMLVVDMLCESGRWDWSHIEHVLSRELVERIARVYPPRCDAGADKPIWRWGTNVNSLPVRRMSFFLIEQLRMRLVNGEEFGRSRCRKGFEFLFGLSFMIAFSQMWSVIVVILRTQTCVGCVVKDRRMFTMYCDHVSGSERMVAIYSGGAFGECYRDNIFVRRDCMVEECKHALCSNQQVPRQPIVQSSWLALPHGWVKLNVDASVSSLDHKAGVGGVLRDEFGRWIFVFSRFLGHCDSLVAELWAIHDGLLQAWESGYTRVELESDCLEAVNIINSSSTALDGSALVNLIKDVIDREWTVVTQHVGCGNNRVADILASRGRGLGAVHMTFSVPHVDIVSLIEEEFWGPTSMWERLLVLVEYLCGINRA